MDKKVIDYGEQTAEFQVPPPASSTPVTEETVKGAGFVGFRPRAAGRVIKPVDLTEEERKALTAAGYQPGDPLPTDTAEQLSGSLERTAQAIRQRALQESLEEISAGESMKIPEEVSLEDLPAEQQLELRKVLEEAKQIVADAEKEADEPGPLPAFSRTKVVDLAIEDDVSPPTASPESAETKPAAKASSTGVHPLAMTHCPQCSFDLAMPAIPDPDSEDRQWYLQALLGNIPFEKAYYLFDGALKLVFRELEYSESDAIYRQVSGELNGVKHTPFDVEEKIRRYRLCLQLAQVETQIEVHKPPRLSERVSLEQISDIVFNQILRKRSVVRIAYTTLANFERLVTKLEDNASRKNFWNAASTP